jgi:hypothetical protein
MCFLSAAKSYTALLAFVGAIGSLYAQTGDTGAIQQKLTSRIRLTTVTKDRGDIVAAGDIVQIHKPGLMMYSVASPMPPSNTYSQKHRKIGQGWGGFGKDMMITMAAPGSGTATDYPHRPIPPEEKCWVTSIQVQRDGVLLQLYSDPYDGVRYYANLKIPFENKKSLPTADGAAQMVNDVLTVLPAESSGAAGQAADDGSGFAPAGSGQADPIPTLAGSYFLKQTGAQLVLEPDGSFALIASNGNRSPGQYSVSGNTLSLTYKATGRSSMYTIRGADLVADTGLAFVRQGGAVADNPPPQQPSPTMQPIAPPPPPADAAPNPPPTVSLGQTMDQVTAIMGQPKSLARAGGKVIFTYPDLKVTFLNGKVSDVQ